MPWLEDDVPNWHELPEAEKEQSRLVLLELGMVFPEEDDSGYYE